MPNKFDHSHDMAANPVAPSGFRDCLIGLVDKGSTSRLEDPGFDSCLHSGNFSQSSQTGDLKIGTPVATLPGAWH